MTTRARICAHLVSLTLIVAALALLQGTAQASCALPPRQSADSFTGTVLSVEDRGRRATVRTEQGKEVVVLGRGVQGGGGGVSSVDRRYAVGARYEFHPINDASPFRDNACTATRQLSGTQHAAEGTSADSLPGWLPVDEDAGPIGYVMLVGIAVAVLAAATVAGLAWRSAVRGRRSRTVLSPES